MKKITLKGIELYQFFSKGLGLTKTQCTFYPSCSEYAHDAIQEYGVLKGGWFSVKRIARCRPGKPFTVDLINHND